MVKWLNFIIFLLSIHNVNANGNTFNAKLNFKVNQIDPVMIDDGWSIQVAFQAFRKLFKINNAGETVFDLASSYTRNSNVHRICIRNDAFFSNGERISIEDVLYSIKRAANPHENKLTSFYFSRIKGYEECKANILACNKLKIEKIDNSCLSIVTQFGEASFFKILTSVASSILKKEKAPNVKYLSDAIFSGEYFIKRIDSKGIFLEKNPFSKKNPYFTTINFYFEDSSQSSNENSRDNFVKFNSNYKNNFLQMKNIYAKSVSTNYFFLISKKSNIDKRKSISSALRCLIDKRMVREIFGFSMQESRSFFPSKLFFTLDKNFLDESSCIKEKHGINETVLIAKEMVSSEQLINKLNQLSEIKKLGIRFVGVDFSTMYGQYLSGDNSNTLLMGMIPGYLDLEYYLLEWFHKSSPVMILSSAQEDIDNYLRQSDRRKKLYYLKKIIKKLKSQNVIVPFVEEVSLFSIKNIKNTNLFSHWGEYSMNISEY